MDIGGDERRAGTADAVPAGRTDARARGRRSSSAPPDEFGRPSRFGEVALHGVPRPREWDAIATVAAELPGQEVHFTSLPDGTLIVEEDVPDGALTPLAEAIEASINPPYAAEGVTSRRLPLGAWAPSGSACARSRRPRRTSSSWSRTGRSSSARRLDGDLFEVRVSPL